MKKLMTFCMALCLAAGSDSIYIRTNAAETPVRILFTHDLSDHVEQFKVLDDENNAVYAGGYEYLASAINDYRTDQCVLLDGGNFSAGTMFGSLNATDAPDLTLMNMMGYDAVTAGLNDFVYGAGYFGEMLSAASAHPSIVSANMTIGNANGSGALKDGWNAAGGSAYTLIDAGGYTVGVFGLCQMSDEYSEGSAVIFTDPLEAGRNAAEALKKDGADLIVCLYSTDEDDFEELCELGTIDVIIAGGKHTAAAEYQKQGSTYIVSSDPYGTSLGVLDIDPDSKSVRNYEQIPVSGSQFTADEAVNNEIVAYRQKVNNTIMTRFGLNQYPVFKTSYSLSTKARTASGKEFAEAADLLTDSMIEAYEASDFDEAKPVSIITEGMVTGTLFEGNVYPDDLFKMAYKGMGSDGIPGYNLVRVYMQGSDLLTLCEADLILHADDSPDKMHFGRMYYEYSNNRPVTNRVIDVYTEEADGYYIAATDDRYYPVITTAEFLESIPEMIEKSGVSGEVHMYDQTGRAVEDLEVMALRNGDGAAIKVWSAIASYAAHFDRGSDGVDVFPDNYKKARMQRTKVSSLNLIKMFKHANAATFSFYTKLVAYPVGILIVLHILVWLINLKKRK